MRLRAFLLSFVSFGAACSSDSSLPTQPTHDITPGAPPGWAGALTSNFTVGSDRTAKRSGQSGLYLGVAVAVPNAGAAVVQSIRAEPYRGKRLRLSAWVTHYNVVGPAIGLWMRVDAPGAVVAFDDMHGRSVAGSASEWHQISVVLDVAKNAERIAFGAAVEGQGTLYVDDMRLEEVGLDVPSTNMFTQPQAAASNDSTSLVLAASQLPDVPSNLDFEAVLAPSPSAVDWVAQHASPLATSDPNASLSDLAPLKAMIGNAHIVGLGEGTHGTREFFRMKHRILEYLVTEMGFTRFAIEATSPEANDVNRYVLRGEGNPRIALSRLYFWTWNTQEVLDMIEWMRNWNSRAGSKEQVQFLGFDMQSPGTAIDSVVSYLRRIDPPNASLAVDRFFCLDAYRNRGEIIPLGPAFYGARTSDADKAKCARGLQEISDTVRANRNAYVARSSSDEYELRLHDARLVQQFEGMASVAGNTAAGGRARDQYMAENVQWIRDQAPAGSRIVLWAHNGHIGRFTGSMGGQLQAKYDADYVPLGFLFGRGSLNAVGVTGSGGPRPWTALQIPGNSLEALFSATNKFSSLLDMRTVASGGAAAAQLTAPIPVRSIGAVFDPSVETLYFQRMKFPDAFDLMVYIENTSASTLLPFVYR